MAEASLELLLRQRERVLEELRLVRSDIGDFRADMEVQSAIIRRLDQSVQSLTARYAPWGHRRIVKGSGSNGYRVR